MRPSLKYSLVEYMKDQPFALVNDGTSDCGIKKAERLMRLYLRGQQFEACQSKGLWRVFNFRRTLFKSCHFIQ